jgi:hypothetical protein
MGLTINLEGEKGNVYETISDNDILSELLPNHDDKSSYCLRFIDLYGDTTFNSLQMPELIRELENILKNEDSDEKHDIVNQIIRLSNRCKEEVHLYLKFYGD